MSAEQWLGTTVLVSKIVAQKAFGALQQITIKFAYSQMVHLFYVNHLRGLFYLISLSYNTHTYFMTAKWFLTLVFAFSLPFPLRGPPSLL